MERELESAAQERAQINTDRKEKEKKVREVKEKEVKVPLSSPVAAHTRSHSHSHVRPLHSYADQASQNISRSSSSQHAQLPPNAQPAPIAQQQQQQQQHQPTPASANPDTSNDAILALMVGMPDYSPPRQPQRAPPPSGNSGRSRAGGQNRPLPSVRIPLSNRFEPLNSISNDAQAPAPAARRRRGPDKQKRMPKSRGSGRASSVRRPASRGGSSRAASRQQQPQPQPPSIHISKALPTPLEISQHDQILPTIPRHSRKLFQKTARPFLHGYFTASLNDDDSGKLNNMSRLLGLPAIALPMPGGKFMGSKLLKEHLAHVSKEIRRLDEQHSIAPSQSQSPRNKYPDDWKLANIRRSIGLLRSGHVGKAAQALTQTGMKDPNDQHVIEQLKQLHPKCKGPLPDLPDDAPFITVDASSKKGKKNLRRLLRRLNNGSAAGPSGFNGAHLLTLALTDDGLRFIGQIMQDIINGKTNSRLREYLTASTLYPLSKSNSDGVRPIAVGEIFKRAADAYINQIVCPIARKLCQPHQFGIGTPGGCEKIVLSVQALLDLNKTNTAFLVDVTNAFNSESRGKIMEAVYNQPGLSSMFRSFHYTYSTPSTLRLPNGIEILSEEGVKQGEVLSSLGYCIKKQPQYKAANDVHPDTVHIFACLDDATAVGPAQHTVDCINKYNEDGKADDQVINWSKCKFLAHPDNVLPASVTDFLNKHGVPIIRDATLLLGAPVGWDREKMAKLALTIHEESSLLFQQIQHPTLPPQEAMIILRMCTVPIPGYLSRVLPPSVLSPAAREFDTKMMDTVTAKLELPPLSVAQRQQLRLKLINGGLGLPSVQALSPIAYTCCVAEAAFFLYNAKPSILPNGELQPGTHFLNDFTSALNSTRLATQTIESSKLLLPTPDPSLPNPDSRSLRWFANLFGDDSKNREGKKKSGIQSTLSHIADKARFNSLLDSQRPVDRARMLSCSGRCASAWLSTIPTDSSCRLHRRAFCIAARLRLGSPAHDEQGKECICRSQNADPDIDNHHGLSCHTVRRSQINFRHDLVKNIMHLWARRLGCSAIKEPQNLIAGQERADNLISTPHGELFLCDVSIVQPACPSHVDKSQTRLGASEHAAGLKHAQYDHMAAQQDARFIPLIGEVYGALHADFIGFIQRLARFAEMDESCPWSRLEALAAMYGSISVAVQRGNVLALDRVHSNNRNAGLILSRSRSNHHGTSVSVNAQSISSAQLQFGAEDDDNDQLASDQARKPSDARVIFPRSALAMHAALVEQDDGDVFAQLAYEAEVAEQFGGELDSDIDDDVIEVPSLDDDLVASLSLGSDDDVQDAAERRSLELDYYN